MKIPSVIRSFKHAWRGLRLTFRTERSFRLQVAAALVVMAAGAALPISHFERLTLLVVIMFILVLELLNSSVERVIDLVKPRLDEYARDVKDLAAGAVLLASLFAILIGILIFGPFLLSALRSL